MHFTASFRATFVIIVLGLMALDLVACGSAKAGATAGKVSTAAANANATKADLCGKLDGLKASLDKLDSLNTSSTFEAAKEASQNVSESLQAVSQAANKTAASRFDLIKTDFDALVSVNDLPGNQKIGVGVTTLTSQVIAISSAASNLKTQVGC